MSIPKLDAVEDFTVAFGSPFAPRPQAHRYKNTHVTASFDMVAIGCWSMDVYFDGKSGAYQPGYYRGVIDTVTRPSKTGIQKLDVDFPDGRTNAKIDLKQPQIY